MKTLALTALSVIGVLSLSACLQATSHDSTVSATRAQSQANRQNTKAKLHTTAMNKTAVAECTSSAGTQNISDIGDGAEGLFQLVLHNPTDLDAIHDSAEKLAALEVDYSQNFITDCAATGLTAANTENRIQKLDSLATETDSIEIHNLAEQLWDLFNPNIVITDDTGKSSANPFAAPVNP